MTRKTRGNPRGRALRGASARSARSHRASTSSFSVPENIHGLFASSLSSQYSSRQTQSVTPQPYNNPPSIRVNDADNESMDHVIMALNRMGNTSIGCAYYVAKHRTLYCLEDMADADGAVITSLKLHTEPTIILTSPKVDLSYEHDMAARLSTQSSLDTADSSESLPPYKVEARPNADFAYEQAIAKLASITTLSAFPDARFLVPGQESEYGEQLVADEYGMSEERGQVLHISSLLNLSSRLSIGCAGAVITYLQRKKSSIYLPEDPAADAAFAINRLEMFSLKGIMLINSDTVAALQIFQPESHPNATKQGPGSSGSKESLSIYGLFCRFTRTPQGKALLRRWFLQPSLDLDKIRQRHDTVSILSRPDNQAAAQSLTKGLGRVKNMRRIAVSLHKGIEGGNQNNGRIKSGVWSSLLEFCYYVLEISETLQEISDFDRSSLFQKLLRSLNRAEFRSMGRNIHEVVDLEESQEQQRTVIKRNIHNHLDKIKDAYDSMDEMLQQTAIDIVRELPEAFGNLPLNVIYFPQLGFHITIPLEAGSNIPVYDGVEVGWEQIFTTNSQAYFKNEKMRQMDEQLGDLYAMICDIEIEVSHDLAQNILKREQLLISASDLCGELDCLLALAQGAREYKLSRPRMSNENVINIKAGRHILQELTVPSFIPNDARLCGGDVQHSIEPQDQCMESQKVKVPNMLLLTGPNYSGKSVYLKQVALIVYMAQIGSFVPAEFVQLGITDKIMTRITTRESVSRASSTFMIDLQQITWAVNSCTSHSLLVIDEFGKGTDNCDGAGLVAGVMHQLLSLGQQSPKVLLSTHFHEMFEITDFEEFPNVMFYHMEVQVDRTAMTKDDGTDQVVYLYNLLPGRSTASFGTQCAAINGIPQAVVARATELNNLALQGEDLVSICSAISHSEYEELSQAEKLCRGFLSLNIDDLVIDGNFLADMLDGTACQVSESDCHNESVTS